MKKYFIIIIILSIIPTIYALKNRIIIDKPGPVVLAIDEQAVREEARLRGVDLDELLDYYRNIGVRGLGIYEMRTSDWVDRGKAVYADGNLLRMIHPGGGFEPGWYYLSPRNLNNLEIFASAWTLPQHRVAWLERVWIGFPKDVLDMPVGPDQEFILQRYRKGNYIIYRPYNDRYRSWPPTLPEPVEAIVFAGDEALGWPNRILKTVNIIKTPIGLVENADQKGVKKLAHKLPVLRVFSLQAEWQLKLSPQAAAEKYLLAARERSQQILYFRPYPEPENTERFIKLVTAGLEQSNIALGKPKPRSLNLPAYKNIAWLGVLAGLALLALSYPQPMGWLLAVALLLVSFLYADSQAGPLLAAIVFASLGFARPVRGMTDWLIAIAFALVGATFLAALGSNTLTINGVVPFKGVLLTLALPPVLVMLAQLPKDKPLKLLLIAAWDHRVRLGEVALVLVGVLSLAIVLLRRGNTNFVPGFELQIRALLQDWMVRPRFKEIFGHSLAVLALTQTWPRWVKTGLLAFATLAEASIINTFSHYHTPLFISFARSVNGVVAGLVLGFLLAGGAWVVRKWLLR